MMMMFFHMYTDVPPKEKPLYRSKAATRAKRPSEDATILSAPEVEAGKFEVPEEVGRAAPAVEAATPAVTTEPVTVAVVAAELTTPAETGMTTTTVGADAADPSLVVA